MGVGIKRVSFRLSLNLSKKFDDKAERSGITKSKLLRRWIKSYGGESFRLQDLPKESQSFTIYSFYIEDGLYQQAKYSSIEQNLTISNFLRCIVIRNLSGDLFNAPRLHRNKVELTPKELWENGSLLQLSELLHKSTEQRDISELLLLVKTDVALGNLTQAEQTMKLAESRVGGLEAAQFERAGIYSTKADLLRVQRKLPEAKMYARLALKSAQECQKRELIAASNFLLAELSAMSDDGNTARNYYYTALEYLDREKFHKEIGMIYFRLANLSNYHGRVEESQRYLDRSLPLLSVSQNAYALSWFYSEKYLFYSLTGNLREAEHSIRQCIHYSKLCGSAQQLFYAYENYGRLELLRQKPTESHATFRKAEKIEKGFRASSNFSHATLFRHHIEAKDRFTESIAMIERLLQDNKSKMRPNFNSYILSATQYIYGNSTAVVRSAEKTLNELSRQKGYSLIQKAAETTLRFKKMVPAY